MNPRKTAILISSEGWTPPPTEPTAVSFDAYRSIGKPEIPLDSLPTGDIRSLPTDHPGKALRTVLIENQERGGDVWVYGSNALWNKAISVDGCFRPALISAVAVRETNEPETLLARSGQCDLTILPWETLRYIDFREVDWIPTEDFLTTYANHANRRGFSPFLSAVEDPKSQYADFGEYIAKSGVLEIESRLFHRHKLLSRIKKYPIRGEQGFSLLVDLTHIRNGYNGTMEYGRNLFKGMVGEYEKSPFASIHAMGEARHVEFHGISRDHLIDPQDRTVFDLCFRPYQIDNPKVFADTVFRGRRFVISQLDAIGSRCDYIYDSTMRFYQQMGIAASDGVVCISEYGLKDAIEFFDLDPQETPSRAFLLAMEPTAEIPESTMSGDDESYMVVGSWRYDHKMLRPALNSVRTIATELNRKVVFHFLGDLSGEPDLPDCIRYHKHNQTQEELDRLFERVHGFIFPSVYEGYGLPIMHAFRFQKPILIADTEVNREIQKSFGGSEVFFFGAEANLTEALRDFIQTKPSRNRPECPRDWNRVALETLDFLAECVRTPPVESDRKRIAREALLMAASQLEEKSEPVTRPQTRNRNPVIPHQPSAESPMHTSTISRSKSILPKPLAEAWVEYRDRLPSGLVRFLKAIRKRIPDGA